MKKLLITLTVTGLMSFAHAEQASEASVLKLLKISGSDAMATQMQAQLKPMAPNAPESFWQEKTEELLGLMVPAYQKHLEQADVDAVIAFYETPAGKRFVAAQPKILQDSMPIVQKWGAELAQELMGKK